MTMRVSSKFLSITAVCLLQASFALMNHSMSLQESKQTKLQQKLLNCIIVIHFYRHVQD